MKHRIQILFAPGVKILIGPEGKEQAVSKITHRVTGYRIEGGLLYMTFSDNSTLIYNTHYITNFWIQVLEE